MQVPVPGDLVTMKRWDDPRLNESLRRLMDKIAQGYPELRRRCLAQRAAGVMAEDSRLSTHAIRQPVTNIDNPRGDRRPYGKDTPRPGYSSGGWA
jgi:aminopeptidase N